MANNTRNSTTTIHVVCAIVFILFVFSYVFCFQPDLLALSQHIWSNGETHYSPGIGAVVITSVLTIIYLGCATTVRIPERSYAVTFLPSLLLLGAITSGQLMADGSFSVGIKGCLACMMIFVTGVIMKVLSNYTPYERPLSSSSLLSECAWCNYAILAVGMLLTVWTGNNDRLTHEKATVELQLQAREYKAAIEEMDEISDADSALTMLRAYALSKNGELGERLFEMPLTNGSRALLPSKGVNARFLIMPDSLLWRHLGGIPRKEITDVKDFLIKLHKQGLARPAATEYLLTAYLLEGDIEGFARNVKKYKNLNDLPKHYREALVLYTHLKSVRVLTYRSSALEADYEDFLKTDRKKYASAEEHNNTLRDAYFGTYWYYYYNWLNIKHYSANRHQG